MKSVLSLAVAVAALAVGAECRNKTTIFAPSLMPNTDRHDLSHIYPSSNISLHYAPNTTAVGNTNINVTHTMKYPAVLLEHIASVSSVQCSADSVAVTFNDSSVFEATEAAWSAEGTFVLITNHLGDCDVELERGMFLVNSLTWCNVSLVATAKSQVANISSVAAQTEITLGAIPSSSLAKRDIVIDPSYTLNTAIALPSETTLFSYSPYLTVSADAASFNSNVTFSGYLSYNWLTFKVEHLYFDVDAEFAADLTLSADITSAYNTTFSYSPSDLTYSLVSIPGILTLGPELTFAVDAEVSASEAVTITANAGIALADGNAHLDLLQESNTGTSGWTPTYTVSAEISGNATAEFNPTAALTVEISILFFGGLIDLSTGLTATPGFDNSFILTAAEGVDLSGVEDVTSSGTCAEGLELQSNFTFGIKAFATEWWSEEIYSVNVPLLDKCYSWE